MVNVKEAGIRKFERAQYVAKPVKRIETRTLSTTEGVRGSESVSASAAVAEVVVVVSKAENVVGLLYGKRIEDA